MSDDTKWKHGPFERHELYTRELNDIENLCQLGLRALVTLGERGMLTEELKGVHPRALAEAQKGYPRLNAQWVILWWGGLERFVDDLIVTFLAHQWGAPKILQTQGAKEKLDSIKVSLAELMPFFGPEYHVHDTELLAKFLLTKIKEAHRSSLSDELSRFETPLSYVGLSGQVKPQSVRDDLREMHLVRNVLVHRNGIVDDRFAAKLPQARWKLGDAIELGLADTNRYMLAGYAYINLLAERMEARIRHDPYSKV